MLGPSQVQLFRQLESPQPASAVAESLDQTPNHIRRLAHQLEEQGLVAWPDGKNRPMSRAMTPHARALEHLVTQFPRVPWEKIITHGGLAILAWLTTRRGADSEIESPTARPVAGFEHKPHSIEELSRATGYQRSYVHQRVMTMAKSGVVVRADGAYALNAQHATLRDFVQQYWIHQDYQAQRRDAPEGRILWQRGPEFLLQAPQLPIARAYKATGITMMAQMGMRLTSKHVLAYRTDRDLSVADHIVHTFLAAPTTSSNVAYACLHYAKARPKDLPEVADLYDVGVPMRLLVQYVESRGGIRAHPLPAWSDFEDLAQLYGVSL